MTYFFFINVFLRSFLIGFVMLWLFAGQDRTRRKKRRLPPETGSRENRKRNRGLSEMQLKDYRKRIDDYLQFETSYLDCDFRMRDMVEETEIPRHHLSVVINSLYNTNFNHFINQHRIDYLLRHFNDPEWAHLSLEGMAREAGFKSRSTFINAFKKVTGMTPSKFREHCKSSNHDEKPAIKKHYPFQEDSHHRFDGHTPRFLHSGPGASAGSA